MSRGEYKKYPYLKKQPNGYYYAYYRDVQGNRRRRSLKTKDQVVASKRFTKLLEDVDRGVLGFSRTPQKLLLRKVAERFLMDGSARLAKATVDRHKIALETHVLPFFKRADLRSVSPKDIQRYISKRERDRAAPNTIYKELAALSAVFNFAVFEEMTQFNPVRAVNKPKIRQVRPNYSPTEDEICRILEHLYPGARRFFLFLCHTGCRISELARLNVGDVDLARERVRVIRKGDHLDFTPLTSTLKTIVAEELAERPNATPPDPLFLNRQKRRYKELRSPLKTACERAGVPHCTHHSFRHALADMLHEAGEKITDISKLLGHSNPTVTQNIYLHWREPSVRRAAEAVRIGENLAKPGSESPDSPRIVPISRQEKKP